MQKLILCLPLCLVSTSAFAQDIATEELEKKALAEKAKDDKKEPDGWKAKGNLGISGSLSDARSFVGVEDGTTFSLGLTVAITADWRMEQHGWENEIKAQHGQSKTPGRPFLKSADQLDIKSTYLYRFTDPDWLGVFGRVKLNTQLLKTKVDRPEVTTFVRPNGASTMATEFRLTGPFEPLTLRESAGAFAKPITEDRLTVKATLGLAAQEVIIRGDESYALGDDDAGVVQLLQLEGQTDFGIEITGEAKGIIVKDLLNWKASLDLFQPVLPNVTEPLKPNRLGRLNVDFLAGVSLKLAKWLSIDYNLTLRRQPIVLQEWQVQNQVLLTAGFDII